MHHLSSEEGERPFPGEAEDTEQQIDDLEHGSGLDSAIEVLGEEVPEDLGPKEALYGGGDLI